VVAALSTWSSRQRDRGEVRMGASENKLCDSFVFIIGWLVTITRLKEGMAAPSPPPDLGGPGAWP